MQATHNTHLLTVGVGMFVHVPLCVDRRALTLPALPAKVMTVRALTGRATPSKTTHVWQHVHINVVGVLLNTSPLHDSALRAGKYVKRIKQAVSCASNTVTTSRNKQEVPSTTQ